MRSLRWSIALVLANAALAGVSGTSVVTFTIQNNTGAAANDLHVNVLGSGPLGIPTVTASSPFTATPSLSTIDFAGPTAGTTVAAGDSATFTLAATGDNWSDTPEVYAFYWTLDGNPQGDPQTPMYAAFTIPPFASPEAQALFLYDNDPASSHDFTDLYARQDGTSVLTIGSSGTVDPGNFDYFTNTLDISAGVLEFGFTDTTSGITVAGTFTPAPVPEPKGIGLVTMMLLGTAVFLRRRQLSKR